MVSVDTRSPFNFVFQRKPLNVAEHYELPHFGDGSPRLASESKSLCRKYGRSFGSRMIILGELHSQTDEKLLGRQ